MMYLEQLGLDSWAPNFRLIGASSRRGQRGWRLRGDPAAYLGRPPSSTSLRFSAVRDVVFEPQGDRISEDTWEWDVGTVDEVKGSTILLAPRRAFPLGCRGAVLHPLPDPPRHAPPGSSR
jgi:hypothetical protein